MAGQYFGDNELKADKITSPSGSSVLDLGNRKLLVGSFEATSSATLIDQIPSMTSFTTPNGYAFASSEANTTNQAWNAFDKNNTTKWTTAARPNGLLGFDFNTGEQITRYVITGPISGQSTKGPKTWTFEGSYDGKTWVVLDTQTNVGTWTALQQRTYDFINDKAYRAYRLNITVNQGATDLSIVELALYSETISSMIDPNGITSFNGANPYPIYDKGGAVYNLKSYGALGDTQTFLDGAVTAGSPNLTSATANFTRNDIGKILAIWDAGPVNSSNTANPDVLQATIVDYIDATTVVLSVNANFTVTGKRFIYGTNDKNVLQGVIDKAYAAGGGIVYVPPGDYIGTFGSNVYVKSNVVLMGAGWGATTIRMTIGFGYGISGSGSPEVVNAKMRDFELNGDCFRGITSGLSYNNTTDCWFENLYVVNVPFWSIIGGFSAGQPISKSLFFRQCVFDRGLLLNNPSSQDMTAFNYNDFVSMKDCEFRNNTNGYATLLFFSQQNKIELESLKFVNCGGAHSFLDTNGLDVFVKNVTTDGGGSYIRGQVLKIDGMDDLISDNVTAGNSHNIQSAACQITNWALATRFNGSTSVLNNSVLHLFDGYRSMSINPDYVNAVTAGDSVLTFTQVPPGFANGMKIRMVDNGDLSNNLEVRTIVSGAGTTTFTLDSPLTLSHPARFVIESITPGDYTVQNSRFGTITLENAGEVNSVTLRFRDLLVSTAGDTYGWIGMPQGSSTITSAFTVNLDWDHVDVNGGIGFNYFAPATNLVTYKGIIRNTRVFGNSTSSWVPAGRINLAQTMQVRFENIEIFTGWSVATGTVFNNGCVFRNIRSSQTGAPIALPTGIGTTPGVPASNAALTNNTGIDATVHISGGTVTVVKVGAVTTGLTSPSTVRVPIGQTITLTYSVAPTWVWIAE